MPRLLRYFASAAPGVGLLFVAAFALPQKAAANEVFDWNVTGFGAAVAGGQNNVVLSRTMAIMHLAIHDALNAIDRRYKPLGKAESSAPLAAADLDWESYLNTPPIPDYPSTHSVPGGAASAVLARALVATNSPSDDRRAAIRGHHAVVQELLPRCAGERRLACLRRDPFLLGLPGRDQARRAIGQQASAQYLQPNRP